MVTALKLIGIGWYIAIFLVGGTILGVWLDRETGASPVFTITGLVFGLAIAGFGTYRMLLMVISKSQDENLEV